MISTELQMADSRESTPPNTPKSDSVDNTSESIPTISPKHDAVDNTKIQVLF